MPAKINLKDQIFGKLLVLEETDKRKNKSVVWKCQCQCGNIVELSTKELRSDGIIQCPSCGVDREPKIKRREDIIGKKFNHLTVLEKTNKLGGGKILYKCECDCPDHNIVYVNRTDLQNGHTKSCGCIKRKYQIGTIINNRKILSFEVSDKEHKKIYYKCRCLFCGREYLATPQTLDHTTSCGCQKSLGEFYLISLFKENNIPFIKEFSFPNSLLRFDFAILNSDQQPIRLIEFDGEQHFIENIKNSGWNTLSKFEYTQQKDLEKNQLAKKYDIPLIRIPYWERENLSLKIVFSDQYLQK